MSKKRSLEEREAATAEALEWLKAEKTAKERPGALELFKAVRLLDAVLVLTDETAVSDARDAVAASLKKWGVEVPQ